MREKLLIEEDLFPKVFANYEEREYGLLFFDEENKDSYDSNHALIYKKKIGNLEMVLNDITQFYENKKITPRLYQACEDEGFFEDNNEDFTKCGYKVWLEEPIKFMVLEEQSTINASGTFEVEIAKKWNEDFNTNIFEEAGEPWEIDVAKKTALSENGRVFIAFFDKKPVGISYMHFTDAVCRFDYILINPDFRGKGCARDILSVMTDYCRQNQINNCFQWPANKVSEKICYEAGFREKFVIVPARASK